MVDGRGGNSSTRAVVSILPRYRPKRRLVFFDCQLKGKKIKAQPRDQTWKSLVLKRR
jgi:hypothetical protein